MGQKKEKIKNNLPKTCEKCIKQNNRLNHNLKVITRGFKAPIEVLKSMQQNISNSNEPFSK